MIEPNFRSSDTVQDHVNFFPGALWKNDQELVPADSDGNVAGTNCSLQLSRKLFQCRVAGGVPKLIVNFLKIIEVE